MPEPAKSTTFRRDFGEASRRWTHGPSIEPDGVRFRLWAPSQREVALVLEAADEPIAMRRGENGMFELLAKHVEPGALYRFRLADGTCAPDPASRFQPQDVHGPSAVVDGGAYHWRAEWSGMDWDDAVLYELHIGAFTPKGTFASAAGKLDRLADLGVTAIQVMPIADFPGRWGWGYDGVYPYAPDASYGSPDDFRAFIDAAHARGIAVILDVVYNHLGPEGNYISLYAPEFVSARNRTPWGAAVNFDGANAAFVRAFYIENAEYWIDEFRLDGLRLDAVHAIFDDSSPDVLEEIAGRLRARFGARIHIVVEDEDNVAAHLARRERRPVRFTAQWNDDIHHVLHVAATGESGGYYSAYVGAELLARAIAEGFAYQGEGMAYRGRPRGSPSADVPPSAFIAFLQNHDQIGNRAFGERLDALAPPDTMRALASVVLISPQTPAIFMGEEWGARQTFPYFCDFSGDLAEKVRAGRRKEFARFPEFADPEVAARIPDPTAEATFRSAKLDWSAANQDRTAFYRAALDARREHVRPLLPAIERGADAEILGERAARIVWRAGDRRLILDANLSAARLAFPAPEGETFWRCGETGPEFGPWSVRWSVAPA